MKPAASLIIKHSIKGITFYFGSIKYEKRHKLPMSRRKEGPIICPWSTLYRVRRSLIGKKIVFSISGVEKTPFNTIHKDELKIDQRPKCWS